MKAKLILTDSYYNIFSLLTDELKGKVNDLSHKNLVFCEEKLSLMTERTIAAKFGGTFNTEVYSFGNFLRAKKPLLNLLSKEGSSMVVKKILSEIPLKRFNRGKINLAPSLFELISQLKSAKITAEDLVTAAENTGGILSSKLSDIVEVYSAYEKFLSEKGLSDQSSALSRLPEVVENDDGIKNSDVYIIGFNAFTGQIRKVISVLLSKAASVTAILTCGENKFAFVNETSDMMRSLCRENKAQLVEIKVASDYSTGGKMIKDGLFNPLYRPTENGIEKPQVFFCAASSISDEIERIAEIIRNKIMGGRCRYRDFAVILPQTAEYKDAVAKNFARLNVPYFLDDRKNPFNFPLPTLISSYCDVFLRGLKIPVLAAFFKNPYIPYERGFKDKFENYLYKYNIEYGKFKKGFTARADEDPEEIAAFEKFRAYITAFFDRFDVAKLISGVLADERTVALSDELMQIGENEDAGINLQVLEKVKGIISEMDRLLPEAKADPSEFKTVFTSGVSAMEISVIPQYNDAVFLGSFRQVAIARAKYLFAAGLTDSVPAFCEDVALLTDDDIDALAEIKVQLEPKIHVVNHRLREEVALGLSAYSDGLYLSYPLSDLSGDETVKSELFAFFEKHFTRKKFPEFDGYMTKAQGMRTFALDCSAFATLKKNDFSYPAGFYKATDGEPEKLVDHANVQVKINLDGGKGRLIGNKLSPTAIEDYYACPYLSFLKHTLKVRNRDTGKINALSVGNMMHDIFKNFIAEVEKVTDDNFEEMFARAAEPVINSNEFMCFDGEENQLSVEIAVKECKTYCRKLTEWYKTSEFKPFKTEVQFGEGEEKRNGYPAVELSGGRYKLEGKIDRVDTYNDYFRIIDYKTGSLDMTDSKIFAGVKLQLYLYSLAVKDKILAGAYYLRVNDEYKAKEEKDKPIMEGKTAENIDSAVNENEERFILVRTPRKIYKADVAAMQKYVKLLAEQAAKQMEEGVIVPSPFKGTCDYCEFASVCGQALKVRNVDGVDDKFIAASVDSVCAAKESENNGSKDGTL